MTKFTIEDLRDIAYRGSYDDLERELALQLLASMEQTPAYLRPFGDDGETFVACDGNDERAITLYTAPQLPQPAVVVNRKAIADRVHGQCSRIPGATFYNAAELALDEVEACRAAMLQSDGTLTNEDAMQLSGNSEQLEPVSNRDELPPNSFTNEDLAGMSHGDNPQANAYRELLARRLNSPVTPDDVLRMDWLVSKTVDVREPMVYGSHSIFWSQTITDEDDDYHATKLREQIDAAMAAEQAAPKQEVK